MSSSFTGTLTVSVTDGVATRTITCSGTLVGGVMSPGGCTQSGAFPPAGLLTLVCSSVGTGTVACSVEGA